MEGCVEAPLQICLQIYILVAGQWPGNYKTSSNYQKEVCYREGVAQRGTAHIGVEIIIFREGRQSAIFREGDLC